MCMVIVINGNLWRARLSLLSWPHYPGPAICHRHCHYLLVARRITFTVMSSPIKITQREGAQE